MSTLVRGRHAAIAAGILLLGAGGPTLAVAASAGGFLEDAQQRYQKGDLRAAIIQLRNALQADSNDLDARRTLGRLYLESGQYEPAEKELRRAYEARPDDTTELLLGRALLALDRPEDVLKIVRGTAEEVGTAQQKTLVRAEAMLNLERLDEAAAISRRRATKCRSFWTSLPTRSRPGS